MDNSTQPLKLRVFGRPAPQGSKKVQRYLPGGRAVLGESSKNVKPWRQSVVYASAALAEEQGILSLLPILHPVIVEIEFLFPRPKSHYGTGKNAETLKPSAPYWTVSAMDGDLDKICRASIDGLSESSGGLLIKDDKLVVSLSASKRYCATGEHPGANISIELIPALEW